MRSRANWPPRSVRKSGWQWRAGPARPRRVRRASGRGPPPCAHRPSHGQAPTAHRSRAVARPSDPEVPRSSRRRPDSLGGPKAIRARKGGDGSRRNREGPCAHHGRAPEPLSPRGPPVRNGPPPRPRGRGGPASPPHGALPVRRDGCRRDAARRFPCPHHGSRSAPRQAWRREGGSVSRIPESGRTSPPSGPAKSGFHAVWPRRVVRLCRVAPSGPPGGPHGYSLS